MKKRLAGLAVAILALLAVACTTTAPVAFKAPEPLAQEVSITIMHTNDMHARIVESKTELGYSRIATAFKEQKAKNPNTILLDAGDTFHGLPIANIDKGAIVVTMMNEIGYSYMTTGNHDYNYGMERLLELGKEAKFKILAANVYKDGKRVFTPYVIQDVQGVRVAFFGLATPETAYKADPKLVAGVTFTDPIVEGRAIANELAGQYDVLVLISHIGTDKSSDPTSIKVAQAIPELDVIIDGHSHTTLDDLVKDNQTPVLIASTGSYGAGLGVVDLVVGTNRAVKSKSARTITVANSPQLKGDASITARLAELTKTQDAILSKKVASTSIALEGKREIVRTQQSNLGTLIASGMLYVTGADIALMNGGGIRDSIPAGDITLKQVYTVMPFGNYIQTGKLKGSELDAVLENGVGKLPAPDGRFPHLAGWSYTLDASKPAGDRVSNIMVGGQPVDPNKEYTLATLNFLFNGGDDYRMLIGKNMADFPSDAEVFQAHLQHLGTVTNDNLVLKK
ncbi:MAG: 5'-nucleotidase C-terminal domain-containing protein [Spirochaetia bacterium]|jgi:5'-nucleotidase/UDP-sugar diphosphatase|nr:5'-nucleotidase C-terminal domain-containing protein [Spirochaetia bacterium]MCE1209876.1 5'-nucleotidase C-terminal domain-containing protein [Spirochaetia bacterium]HOI22327.1 5'-nucleotidase C-terminal domain-containing protein [Spirochaetales bacterium]